WQPTTPAQKIKQTSSHLLRAAGKWLVKTLTEGNQLRVWTQETSDGTRWYVRNPDDNMQHQFDSEEALRVWLEARYYNG
ncbi:MAG: hypothetical protein F6K11_37175, partial [Leptolyngbya sp. SIO3F4]|nr:hypothetical protein [Leptolyngbya sp. SIO3F4]